MITLFEIIFYISIGVIIYVYSGYPLLIFIASRFISRTETTDPKEWPSITLVIAAYNEEKIIDVKLRNSLELDYPSDKLEIIVGSDASNDRTEEIVKGYANKGVHLLRVEGREGKTAVQNAVTAIATGEFIVFSDANALYSRDTLKLLIRRFSDPSVGCVEGRRMDREEFSTAAGKHELLFRDYESQIKILESMVNSCVGATGPIYAVRKCVYVPLPKEVISDLIEPTMIMCLHNKRQVFEPEAVSSEYVTNSINVEFHRKIRIMTRALYSIAKMNEIGGFLNPFKQGWFAVQFISHRFLRYLVPVFLVLLFTSNFVLLDINFYYYTFLLQCTFLSLGIMGPILDRTGFGPIILRLPYFFLMANTSALIALINRMRMRNIIAWNTNRETG